MFFSVYFLFVKCRRLSISALTGYRTGNSFCVESSFIQNLNNPNPHSKEVKGASVNTKWQQCCGSRMIFASDPDPIFHLVYDPYQDLVPALDPVSEPT